MTIEQKPELNRHIDSTIPLTWAYRRRLLGILLPLLLFMEAIIVESNWLEAIISDRHKPWSLTDLLVGLGGGLMITAFYAGMLEILVRQQHRTTRKFQILEKHIAVTPAQRRRIKWDRIAKFQFIPVFGLPGTTVLKLLATAPARRPTRFTMVLDNPDQASELKRQLENKKKESRLGYQIEVSKEPFKLVLPPPSSLWGLYISLAGCMCLIHAILFFAMWTGAHEALTSPSEPEATSSPFARFMASHFSSRQQFADTLMALSICFGVAGLGLMLWGKQLSKQKPAAHGQINTLIHNA